MSGEKAFEEIEADWDRVRAESTRVNREVLESLERCNASMARAENGLRKARMEYVCRKFR